MNQGEHLQKGRCFSFIFERVCALVRGAERSCSRANSDYGYDKELGKWFAWATFEMEDSEVEWLRNLLSADTVIMRFEGTDYSKFDYTWTVQDRQAITDIIDLYNLLKAVTPEVREKALRN